MENPQILHDYLPFQPWLADHTRRLPGIQPLGDAPWAWRDERFSEQMSYRDYLLKEKTREVYQAAGAEIEKEVSTFVFDQIAKDPMYRIGEEEILRPDGVSIPRDETLMSAARLIQEDLLLHVKNGAEHVLCAGVLCFPANWRLSEKLNRPLTAIHAPVARYDARISRSVQRMFDALQPERPIWRANFLPYRDADLFQPHRYHEAPKKARFIRVERQILQKLPITGVVIFSLHSFVVKATREMAEEVAKFAHR